MKPSLLASTFIKWFIVFAAIVTGNVIAAQYGIHSLVFQSDVSYISPVITCLFLVGSGFAGKLAYDVSRKKVLISKTSVKRTLHSLHWLTGAFFLIGLLGTVVGLYVMLQGNLGGIETDMQAVAMKIKSGSATKLFTTAAGIVSSLLLQAQLLVIETDLIRE